MMVRPKALERDANPFEAKETSRQQQKPWRGPLGLSTAARELLPPFYLLLYISKKAASFTLFFLLLVV